MEQKLEFGTCDPTIVSSQPPVPEVIAVAEKTEVATLKVPIDYENLDGETLDIAVTRNAATGNDRIRSVVLTTDRIRSLPVAGTRSAAMSIVSIAGCA